jgi:hypothetical protein
MSECAYGDVDFGFKVGLAEFEKPKRYGKMSPAAFSVSIETGSRFFRFQSGLIYRLIDHMLNELAVDRGRSKSTDEDVQSWKPALERKGVFA